MAVSTFMDMATISSQSMIPIPEALRHSTYTHLHIATLARKGKIVAKKVGDEWLIDLSSLQEYEARLKEIGRKGYWKFREVKPKRGD